MRLNLNQEDLAQAGGVNRNTQGSYERGVRAPDTAYLLGVSSLGVDTVYILTGRRPGAETLSETESRIIDQFRAISEFDQQALCRFLQAMADDARAKKK